MDNAKTRSRSEWRPKIWGDPDPKSTKMIRKFLKNNNDRDQVDNHHLSGYRGQQPPPDSRTSTRTSTISSLNKLNQIYQHSMHARALVNWAQHHTSKINYALHHTTTIKASCQPDWITWSDDYINLLYLTREHAEKCAAHSIKSRIMIGRRTFFCGRRLGRSLRKFPKSAAPPGSALDPPFSFSFFSSSIDRLDIDRLSTSSIVVVEVRSPKL